MGFRSSRSSKLLPPPARTILLYAADGLASKNGNLSPAGKPRAPARSVWVPMFRRLVDSDEGMQTILSLAQAGMRAWNCPTTMVKCLGGAFNDITFRALSIAALQNFAETAGEKIVLPSPEKPHRAPPRSPAAPKVAPKPVVVLPLGFPYRPVMPRHPRNAPTPSVM